LPVRSISSGTISSGSRTLFAPVSLRDPATKLVISREIDVIEVQTIEKALFLDLTSKLLNLSLDIPLAHVGRTDEGA
jgi:hypothetical protein